MEMDTLRLYRPTLVTILVFSRDAGNNGGAGRDAAPEAEELADRVRNLRAMPDNLIVHVEGDLIVAAHTSVPCRLPAEDEDPLCEIKMDELVQKSSGAYEDGRRLGEKVGEKVRGLRYLGAYVLIAVGSERSYWFQTKIDMSQMIVSLKQDEKVLKDLSARSKIDTLASKLEGGRSYMGNSLMQVRGDPLLLGLKPSGSDPESPIPVYYLLNITYGESDDNRLTTMDEGYFIARVEDVIDSFGRMLAYKSMLIDRERSVLPGEKQRASRIRGKIQELQAAINALLRGELKDEDLARLSRGGRTPSGKTQEEKLLHLASRYFSQVMEFDAALESNTIDTHENKLNGERLSDQLGMTRIPPSELEGESVLSLREEMERFANNVYFSYQSLRDTVNNSQRNLSNSVDILKTSLENKQREINEKREGTWNLLIVILACLGLMDAITNFAIFYLQGERTPAAAQEAITWFLLSMVPIVLVLLVLVIFLRKRLG